jgi:tetratricopeptide (TPR) repeat protein
VCGIAGIASIAIAACRAPAPAARGGAPLRFEYAGCAAVVGAGTCELPANGAIRVWIGEEPGAPVQPVFSASPGGEVAATAATVAGGTLYRLSVPLGARALTLQRPGSAGPEGTIRFVEPPAEWVRTARTAKQRGDLDLAERLATGALASHDAAERAVALGLVARVELARGKTPAAVRSFRDAMAADRDAGRISDFADDGCALAFTLDQRGHEYAEARAVLDDVERSVAAYAGGRAGVPYYRAQLAIEVGDMAHALADATRARDDAHKLGLVRLEIDARQLRTLQLRQLGRWDEAIDELNALERDTRALEEVDACRHSVIASSLGFAILDRAEAHDDGDDVAGARLDPIGAFTRARDAAARCPDVGSAELALEGMALALSRMGRAAEARVALEGSRAPRAIESRGGSILRRLEIDGRAAVAERRLADALAIFAHQEDLAAQSFDTPQRWRAVTSTAETLDAMGRSDAALSAYRRAEALLDEGSARVPLGEGRDAFVGGRERSARLGVDLLLRMGRPREAFAMARAARARVLGSVAWGARLGSLGEAERARWEAALAAYRRTRDDLDAEAGRDWKLTAPDLEAARAARRAREHEARATLENAVARKMTPTRPASLRAPAKDEAWLGYFPVRRGWVAFIASPRTVDAFRVSTPLPSAPSALAAMLLEPASRTIGEAHRLRVLPYGPFRSIDFHALPWRGAPLVAALPVEYALDLADEPRSNDASQALVVSNPNGNLSAGPEEAEAVMAALRTNGGWEVRALEDEEVTRTALLDALGRARLFHYAGHGVFGGVDGSESALLLARGGRLTLGDVLSLPSVPDRVVLSGCETARASDAARAEGLGLARAFLAAGARLVVAPVRAIDDGLSLRFARALYDALASPDVDAAEAVRRAQLALVGESGDWSAFRVVTR